MNSFLPSKKKAPRFRGAQKKTYEKYFILK